MQQQSHASRGGDEAGLMEVEAGAGIPGSGVLSGVPAAVGIRAAVGGVAGGGAASGAYGDSGSDSGVSSLRSAGSGDERSGSRSSALSVDEATNSSTPAAATTPARVWHVQSVQHTSLLMAHPQPPPTAGPSSAAAAAATAPPVGYQSPAPPPGHHHPAVASEMLWRSQRYPPLPHSLLGPAPPTTEEIVERERILR